MMANNNKVNTIALAGNPNCGKTALFNALTGRRQKVGNWPGVTVERKSGKMCYQRQTFHVVDLPGAYSLSVVSAEGSIDERIACDYLQSGQADLIVNIVDASNLERNLYLTLQLLEMQLPVVLVVNMLDVMQKRRITLDLKKLSKLLGCPVVGCIASQSQGIAELKALIQKTLTNPKHSKLQLKLPKLIADTMTELAIELAVTSKHAISLPQASWRAKQLLAGDVLVAEQVDPKWRAYAEKKVKFLEEALHEEPDILIADARYRLANHIAERVTQLLYASRPTVTQLIDKVVLNRFLGIPIFLLIMYCMFLFAINVAGAFQDFFDIGSNTLLVTGVAHLLAGWHFPAWLTAIIANGIGKGINTTITFIPVIGGMFLFLSFLEDSGYMARAAFVVDRLMRAVGLPGQAFVPMIVGFGCNVPAVMGARTLANRRDRILTVMMMPFMSCGARLAIFAVFASAFFKNGGENIIFLLYLLGIIVAVFTGLCLRKTLLRGDPAPMVMEMPSYHMPRLSSICRHAGYRLQQFLKRASRMIIPICVLIGALNAISIHGKLMENGGQQSLLAAVGRVTTPILKPMGIKQDNWPATVGLVTGVLAKEVVVGSLNTLYSQAGHLTEQEAVQFNLWQGLHDAIMSIPNNLAGLGNALRNPLKANEAPHEINHAVYGLLYQRFGGKIAAFSYLLFVLLYFPCISTMAAMRREVGRTWTYFSMLWSSVIAYVLAVFVYQLLTILAHPYSSLLWLIAITLVLSGLILGLRFYANQSDAQSATDLMPPYIGKGVSL